MSRRAPPSAEKADVPSAEEADVGVDFRPSRDGWRFGNDWPEGAAVIVAGRALGRVHGGLCGGMAATAGRAWVFGRPLPSLTRGPTQGPVAAQLWWAQVRSLDLPLGLARWFALQLPPAGAARRGSTLAGALPDVRHRLARGAPVTLGLLRAVSWSPGAMTAHHVVLVYRARVQPGAPGLPADAVELSVYDPNFPRDDGVRLLVRADGAVRHNRSSRPVHALMAVR